MAYSFANPSATHDTNIGGTPSVVNAIRDSSPRTKLYFAASSEMFGRPEVVPQNEETPFRISKSLYTCPSRAGLAVIKK